MIVRDIIKFNRKNQNIIIVVSIVIGFTMILGSGYIDLNMGNEILGKTVGYIGAIFVLIFGLNMVDKIITDLKK